MVDERFQADFLRMTNATLEAFWTIFRSFRDIIFVICDGIGNIAKRTPSFENISYIYFP